MIKPLVLKTRSKQIYTQIPEVRLPHASCHVVCLLWKVILPKEDKQECFVYMLIKQFGQLINCYVAELPQSVGKVALDRDTDKNSSDYIMGVRSSGVRRKFSRRMTKFRPNRVTSQINFRGSAEGTTILEGSGGMAPGKFCKITPKYTHFCAFWKQFLDYTVFTFVYF